MKVFSKVLGLALVLIILSAVVGGGYLAARRLTSVVLRLDFRTAIVSGSIALMVLLGWMIAAAIRSLGARDVNALRQAGKAGAYRLFVDLWQPLLLVWHTEDAVASQQIQEVGRLLLLHGSAAVIKAHSAMQSLPLPEARIQFANALLEIRKDLGAESRGLLGKDLADMLLGTDIDAAPLSRRNSPADTQPWVSLASNS